MKRCPYCAEEIDDAAVYCQYCGHDTRKAPPPVRQATALRDAEKVQQDPDTNKGLALTVLAVVVVLVFGAWYAIDGKNRIRLPASSSEAPIPQATAIPVSVPQYIATVPAEQPAQAPGSSGSSKPNTAAGETNAGGVGLLETMTRIRKNIQALAQDYEVEVHCERDFPDSVLNNYEAVKYAPEFSISNAMQGAYTDYRKAVDTIARTNNDLYMHCSAWVNGTATSNIVSRQTWGTARQGVDEALQAIDAAIAKLK